MNPPALPGLVVRADEPLAPRTTLRIGGPARWLVEARTLAALSAFRRWASETGTRVLALGKGSNLLVPDEGFDGAVLVLAGEMTSYRLDGTTLVTSGGASLMALAVAARNAGLSGLEGLSGIPSTLGGAVRINAGAYGREIFDLLRDVTLVGADGAVRQVPAAGLRRGYRWTELCEADDLVAGASLLLEPAPREEVEARMREVTEKRKRALPVEPNAGSIFRNPPGEYAGRLLEACGLKGRRRGGAEVSGRHANVIVNLGGATARDVRALMAGMSALVGLRFGVELVPEIVLVGGPLRDDEAAPLSVESTA
ncbi:UDP-N-acetylmuramate dehydrogenase [Acidobacteria bacterium ACD]|nr:UDP-N-acetylmuramate dehydrogenase [Acidobacteria bacterium ACD]